MRTHRFRAWLRPLRPTSRAGPIGLELGSHTFRAVQLERRGRDLCLRAALHGEVPEGSETPDLRALRDTLRRGLRGAGFRGRRAVVVLPARDVKLMLLNYEARGSDDASAILGVVGERLQDAVREHVVDYVPLRTTGDRQGEKSALVAAVLRETAEGYLDALGGAGLRVDSIEIAPVALRRAIGRLTADSADENVLAIDCRRQSSTLHVLWGRRLLLYRDVDFAESKAVDQVAKALDLDASAAAKMLSGHGVESRPAADGADVGATLLEILKPQLYALSEHVNKAVIYTASKTHGASLHRVFLYGTPARWPGLAEFLGRLLSLPVLAVDPLAPFRPDAGGERDGAEAAGVGVSNSEYAVAAGLALKGWDADG